MTSPNDEIVKRIDGIYSNKNPNSNIRYVINESRFNASQLCKTKKGINKCRMSGSLRMVVKEFLEAVNGDKQLVDEIRIALEKGQVEKVLSRVGKDGKVTTYRLNSNGEIIGVLFFFPQYEFYRRTLKSKTLSKLVFQIPLIRVMHKLHIVYKKNK